MSPKHRDIRWEHAKSVGGSRKIMKCHYCGKTLHGGITKMKKHLAHVSKQVEPSLKVPKEVSKLLRHLSERSKERTAIKSKKEQVMKSLSGEAFHEIGDDKSEN